MAVLFFSYSHKDEVLRNKLERADIILLLVSTDFVASDYCYDIEMTRAMARHEAGEAHVIPVVLRCGRARVRLMAWSDGLCRHQAVSHCAIGRVRKGRRGLPCESR